jgi:uncharacterized protein YcbK (DUF882 family)
VFIAAALFYNLPSKIKVLRNPMGAKKLLITSSLALLAAFSAAPAAFAASTVHSVHKGARYKHRAHYRAVKWNPVLRGSRDSMTRQNEEIDRLQLPRIADQQQLAELERTGELVPIQETSALRWSSAIQGDKRYVRPWTNQFVVDMSNAFYKEFHAPLQVNSAVRTMEQQQKLRRHNRNAAPETGEIASSHMAGITVDLARRTLTPAQHQWVEDYLKNMRDQGLVEAAEERSTWCFHVMVSDRYTEWREANIFADKITH